MRNVLPIILLFFICALPSYSQISGQGYEVGHLRFEGNDKLNVDQLLSVIRTRETPWALWKWIYHRFDKEILGGQKPEYFDPLIFTTDYHQLRRFYRDNGFFNAHIDTSIIILPDKERIDLTFSIHEEQQSMIDTILYKGFENLSPDLIEELLSNKQVKVGGPYVRNKVEAELRRIVGIFANNGYVNAKVVMLDAQRYASTNNFSIVFAFNPGRRYTFGKISVKQDTTSPNLIDSAIVLRHLDFSQGEYYGEQKIVESERNLNRLGIFDATKIENAIQDISSERSDIPIRVLVRTRAFQELTPEIGVNDENNAFNVLLGIGYNHRNFFGGARNFSTRLRLNVQSLQLRTIFNGKGLRDTSLIAKGELTVQLVQPYFFNNKTSISVSMSGMLDKQISYYIPSLSLRIGTLSQTATYTKLFIDWNLQLSDPKTVASLQDTLLPLTSTEFTKQFNSFITVTLQRDKRNDIFNPSEGILQSISVEEGGLFPHTFGKLLGLDLPYAQYVKLSLDGQWYWDPSNKRDLIWATRWRTGAALLYGKSPLDDIPLTQRFFSGGSGSVRGWRARDLGMVNHKTEGGDAFFEGNLEARWNPLNDAGSLWVLDLKKISFVIFYDCGNVWSNPKKMRLNEIAMAFGLGLRYHTIAGPIRIDFGMKLYDPDEPDDSRRWVTQKRFFPETFSQGILHLGIGHTF